MKFCILVLAILLVGCGSEGGNAPQTVSTPGSSLSFSTNDAVVVNAASPVRSAMVAMSAPSTPVIGSDFEMGDLNKTSTYLFELRNTGTQATNVILVSDNPAVTIVPSSIGIISNSGSGGMIPIIQVTVAHGISPNGIGSAPTLPAGRLSFTIEAQILGGDVGHPVRDPQPCHGRDQVRTGDAAATLGMTVRVTNFEIKAGYDAVPEGVPLSLVNTGSSFSVWSSNDPFTDTSWSLITQDGIIPACPVWFLNQYEFWYNGTVPSDQVVPVEAQQHGVTTITNTGNTVLTVRRFNPSLPGQQSTSPLATTDTIQPGATLTLPESAIMDSFITNENGTAFYTDTVLKINGSGAVYADGCLQPNYGAAFWMGIHSDPIWQQVAGG